MYPFEQKPVPVQTWRYHLPNTEQFEGWCIAFLDSTGAFTCLSDYGNYGYRWSRSGFPSSDTDFREFFLRFDPEYLLSKIASRDHYDGEATLKAIRQDILERRRQGDLSKEQAAFEWAAVNEYEISDHAEEFARWCFDCSELPEPWEYRVTVYPPQACAFVEHVLPRLRAAIDADLSRTLGVSVEEQLQNAMAEELRLKRALHAANQKIAAGFTAAYFEHKRSESEKGCTECSQPPSQH